MCKWGTDTLVEVVMPADLSHTGMPRKALKGIDSCISGIVKALADAGIVMRSSCCGHGDYDGEIILEDGRKLVIKEAN